MIVLGIAGSRKRNKPQDRQMLKQKIIGLKPNMIITDGVQSDGPSVFAKQIGKELGIKVKEYRPWYPEIPPPPPRTRQQELDAREVRKALIGLHATHLIFMTHPAGKRGEFIVAYWFMRFHGELERYKNFIIL